MLIRSILGAAGLLAATARSSDHSLHGHGRRGIQQVAGAAKLSCGTDRALT